VHHASLGPRRDLDPAPLGEIIGEPLELLPPEIHLTTAEAERELHALAVLEKLLRSVALPLQVVRVRAGPHPQLLELRDVLLLLRLGVLLLLRITELAVVEKAANRGVCGGSDLDEIEAFLLSHAEGFLGGDDTDLLSGSPDQANLRDSNLAICAVLLFGPNRHETRTTRSVHTSPFVYETNPRVSTGARSNKP